MNAARRSEPRSAGCSRIRTQSAAVNKSGSPTEDLSPDYYHSQFEQVAETKAKLGRELVDWREFLERPRKSNNGPSLSLGQLSTDLKASDLVKNVSPADAPVRPCLIPTSYCLDRSERYTSKSFEFLFFNAFSARPRSQARLPMPENCSSESRTIGTTFGNVLGTKKQLNNPKNLSVVIQHKSSSLVIGAKDANPRLFYDEGSPDLHLSLPDQRRTLHPEQLSPFVFKSASKGQAVAQRDSFTLSSSKNQSGSPGITTVLNIPTSHVTTVQTGLCPQKLCKETGNLKELLTTPRSAPLLVNLHLPRLPPDDHASRQKAKEQLNQFQSMLDKFVSSQRTVQEQIFRTMVKRRQENEQAASLSTSSSAGQSQSPRKTTTHLISTSPRLERANSVRTTTRATTRSQLTSPDMRLDTCAQLDTRTSDNREDAVLVDHSGRDHRKSHPEATESFRIMKATIAKISGQEAYSRSYNAARNFSTNPEVISLRGRRPRTTTNQSSDSQQSTNTRTSTDTCRARTRPSSSKRLSEVSSHVRADSDQTTTTISSMTSTQSNYTYF